MDILQDFSTDELLAFSRHIDSILRNPDFQNWFAKNGLKTEKDHPKVCYERNEPGGTVAVYESAKQTGNPVFIRLHNPFNHAANRFITENFFRGRGPISFRNLEFIRYLTYQGYDSIIFSEDDTIRYAIFSPDNVWPLLS